MSTRLFSAAPWFCAAGGIDLVIAPAALLPERDGCQGARPRSDSPLHDDFYNTWREQIARHLIPQRIFLTVSLGVFILGGLFAGVMFLNDVQSVVERESGVVVDSPATRPPATPVPLPDFDDVSLPFPPASAVRTPEPASPSGRLTIILLGVVQRPDQVGPGADPGRTDAMLLTSVDYTAGTVAMVSIPRDGFVQIQNHRPGRVNAAYTFGEVTKQGSGPELAKQTVAESLGVPVDRYAVIDIHAMERLIDSLGGIWIDNPTRLVDHRYPTDDHGVMTIDIPAGRQLMDGRTAVQYARTRYPDSDFGRQERQQQVLLAIRDRALQIDVLPRLPSLLPELVGLVRTDLAVTEILALAEFGSRLDRERDIVALKPDPSLTPPYIGPGGAAYVNLTAEYREAVHLLVTQPRVYAAAESSAPALSHPRE